MTHQSFVARELERVQRAISETTDPATHDRLMVAQQALVWALEPTGFASPYAMITGEKDDAPPVTRGPLGNSDAVTRGAAAPEGPPDGSECSGMNKNTPTQGNNQ